MALSQEHEVIVLMNCTNARIFISAKFHAVSRVGNIDSYCNSWNIFWVPPKASPWTRCQGWEGNKTCLQLSVTLLDAGDTQMIKTCSLPASGTATMVVIDMKTNDHNIQSKAAQITEMCTRFRSSTHGMPTQITLVHLPLGTYFPEVFVNQIIWNASKVPFCWKKAVMSLFKIKP